MIPDNLLYTRDHEWTSVKDNIATVGITDYAQESLGEITFIELPRIGQALTPHSFLGSVESSKAASDIYSPIAGTVIEVNQSLVSQPEMVNTDCYGVGWICKVKMTSEDSLKTLLTPQQYGDFLKNL